MGCEQGRRNDTCKASLSKSRTHCWNTKTNEKAKANCKLVVRKVNGAWSAYLVATTDIERHTEIAWHYSSSHVMSTSYTSKSLSFSAIEVVDKLLLLSIQMMPYSCH